MTEMIRPPGKTTIAPEVLTNIARLTALNVTGVKRMAIVPGDVNHIFNPGANEGVKINVENNVVSADVYVILKRDVNIREVCRLLQSQIARSISEMVGMQVGKVNIHVEDIDYSVETED
jgi:uncharacterized alkaline shock family protein YloU